MTEPPARLISALADRYRIERELGQGGMATVYLAEDLKHDRKVAIKVLKPELSAVIGAERFLREIKTIASLQHPHILGLIDSGELDGTAYYVMPFVEGESLRDRLQREKQLPVPDAVRIAGEVAAALDYAHRHGVIHRDIKPENILLHDGRALVADFGIALAVTTAGGTRMTETGMSLGTPHYMSPEQAMGEREITARSDVYALGCVLYEMLVGEPPFTGPTAQAIAAKVMTEKAPSIIPRRDRVPPHVEEAVLTALEKLPADRFAGAAEFAAALQGEGTGTTRRGVAASRGRARGRVHPAWPVALTIVALLGGWGWWRAASGTERAPVIRYIVSLDSILESVDAMGQLAISPDGDLLAYSTMAGPLFMRRRDAVAFIEVPGTEGARTPFFSPDGKSIGYVVGVKLMVKPLSGGPAIVYADLLPGGQLTWDSDGYIYGMYQVLKGSGSPIWRMTAEPRAPLEPITTVDSGAGERWHLHPEVLPDGRGVIFAVEHRDRGSLIAAIRPGETSHRVLTTGVRALYTRDGHLLYSTRDGKLWSVGFDTKSLTLQGSPTLVAEHLRTTLLGPLDFALSASGTLAYTESLAGDLREVVWVSRDGRVQPIDSTWQAPFAGPAVSPDGSRFAVSIREGGASDVWVRDVRGGPATRLTFGNGVHEGASWTPDGLSVTYLSGAERLTDVWSRRADGSAGQVRLLESSRPISEASWSPVGGWVLVRTTTLTEGAGDILAFRQPGDMKPVPIRDSPRSEYTPTVSPDGRWMAYASDETGRFEVYVVPFPVPGTARWQVSVAGGAMPRWSRGGGEIFFLDPSSHLIATAVTLRPEFAVGRTQRLFNASGFVVDGFSRRNFDVAAGDQRFLMLRPAHGARSLHLVVVENWRAEGAR